MLTTLHLDKLPKATGLRSLNFKRTTPGSYERLLFAKHANPREPVVDPSHPLAQYRPIKFQRLLPDYKTPYFTVQAYPKALLGKPETDQLEHPPFTRRPRIEYKDEDIGTQVKQMDMSMVHFMSKKSIKNSSVIRRKIKSRLKNIVSLVVTRDAMKRPGTSELVTGSGSGHRLISQDWTYLFIPTLEVYRAPAETLVDVVREALRSISSKCKELEENLNDPSNSVYQLLRPRNPKVLRPASAKDRETERRGADFGYTLSKVVDDLLLEDGEYDLVKASSTKEDIPKSSMPFPQEKEKATEALFKRKPLLRVPDNKEKLRIKRKAKLR